MYLGFLTIQCSVRGFSAVSNDSAIIASGENRCSKNSPCCQQTKEQEESENTDANNDCNSCERCCCYCCGIIVTPIALQSPEIIFSAKLKSVYSSDMVAMHSEDYFQPPEIA